MRDLLSRFVISKFQKLAKKPEVVELLSLYKEVSGEDRFVNWAEDKRNTLV